MGLPSKGQGIDYISPGVVIPTAPQPPSPPLPTDIAITFAKRITTGGNSNQDFEVPAGYNLYPQEGFSSCPNGEQADKQIKINFQYRPSGSGNTWVMTLYGNDRKPFPTVNEAGTPIAPLGPGDELRVQFDNDSGENLPLFGGFYGFLRPI